MSKPAKDETCALHVAFGESAGGSLRQALHGARRKDRIIVCPENLSFGPIDLKPSARMAWTERELGLRCAASHRAAFVKRCNAFWDKALSRARRVVWVSRRSASEYAGFLEVVWRFGDESFEVVDLTDIEIAWPDEKPAPLLSLGELNPDRLRENALWDRAAPLGTAARDRYREMWRVLRAENAPFRIVAGDDLISAPITVYDELLLSCATDEWRSAAYIIGDTFGVTRDRGLDVGDLVLLGRVRALVAAGRLELQGNLSEMRFGKVRLPQLDG